MKIYDTNKNLIAVFKKYKDIKNSKNFLTDNKDEFQFGTFNLEKGDEIKRHIHYEQPRNIYGTSEAIVVLDGSLKVSFFDNDKKFIDRLITNLDDKETKVAAMLIKELLRARVYQRFPFSQAKEELETLKVEMEKYHGVTKLSAEHLSEIGKFNNLIKFAI